MEKQRVFLTALLELRFRLTIPSEKFWLLFKAIGLKMCLLLAHDTIEAKITCIK